MSIVVNVVETYKKLWGEAIREYELTIIPTSILSESDISIIDLESIEDGEYSREMQAVSDTSGNLKYMLGDFKDTYVNSSDDALVVLKAYKNQFGITDESVEFKFISSSKSSQYVVYKFCVMYNGYKVEDCYANITVNYKDNSLKKISIDTDELNGINIQEPAFSIEEFDSIIDKYMTNNIESEYYVIIEKENAIQNNINVMVYNVTTSDKSSYKIIINSNTGEIIECIDVVSNSEMRPLFRFKADCSSQTEDEKDIEFTATELDTFVLDFWSKPYVLNDMNRGIHAVDNEGWWGLYRAAEKASNKEEQGFFDVLTMIGGVLDNFIELQLTSEISSKTPYFEDKIAAQAYKNFQIAYDWYKDTYDLISYDGNGTEVLVRMHCKNNFNNASWDGFSKSFKINPVTKYKYSLGIHPEVIGHEYTHAVFESASVSLDSDKNIEVRGLNEAYADIMGCIVSGSQNWLMGDNFDTDGNRLLTRDIPSINNSACSTKYPETYKGEYWKEEEHVISVMISHVAWEMFNSDLFSSKDVADIWYNSLYLGYDNSSTFVTCRKYIIQTADDLGYSDEQIDFIANAFDEREIFDESYKFRTDKYEDTNEATSDGSETIKTEEKSIDGDPLLDNSKKHRFLIGYSILESFIAGEGIYIYEESNGMTKDEQEAFTNRLNEQIANKYDIKSLSGKQITVQYQQIPSWGIDFIDRFCSHTMNTVKGKTYSLLDSEEFEDKDFKGFLDKMFKLAFDWEITESTAYDFYTKFGLID